MKRLCGLVLWAVIVTASLPSFAAPVKIQEVTSPGGLKAWLVEDDRLPLFTLHFAWRGGVEQDPADKQGLATLSMSLMNEGAGPYDSTAFQKALADQSIQLSFAAGRDALTGSLKTLRETRQDAFRLLRLSLTEPRFDAEAFDRLRQEQGASIKAQLGSPEWQGRYALFSTIFAGHPYGYRSLGSTETLASLTRDDARSFVRSHLAKDNLIISAAGSITPKELGAALDELFGKLPDHAQLAAIPEITFPEKPTSVLVERDGTQTLMLFAEQGPKRDDPDWFPALVANYILGGGELSSRLMHEVRETKGLTYGVGTTLASMERTGMIIGQFAASNGKAATAWDDVRAVWSDLQQNGPFREEVAHAKSYLIGVQALALTSTEAIAALLTDVQRQNLGIDYLERREKLIDAVLPGEVRRALIRFFDPARLTVVAVGKPEAGDFAKERSLTKE